MINKNLFDNTAWFIAIGASKFISGPIGEIDLVEKSESEFLEIRVFDSKHEIKYIRGSLCGDFQKRDSADIQCDKSRKEIQFLDIDDENKREHKNNNNIWATGGGEYRLPDDKPDRIVIEHYYKTDDKEFYKPFDFRVVRFLKKGEKFDGLC